MALDRDTLLLQSLPLFTHCETEALRILVFAADKRPFSEGSTLFKRGDRSDGGHLVLEGEIRLDPQDGREPQIVGTGFLIGESALFAETERPALAVAVKRSVTLRISRLLMQRVLGEYPETARILQRTIAARLADTRSELAGVAQLLG
jgi:CRP-like cAMP-binding protein